MAVMSRQVTEPEFLGTPESPKRPALGLSPRQMFVREFRKDKLAIVGLVVIAVMIALALAAPIISRYVVHHTPSHLYIEKLDPQFGLPTGPS